MILILSSEDDNSTNDVIDWLYYYKVKFVRISKKNRLKIKSIKILNNEIDISLIIDSLEYKLSDFNGFWYRRSEFHFIIERFKEIANTDIDNSLNNFLVNETSQMIRFVKKYIAKRSLNKFDDIFLNKLNVLHEAAAVGMFVPLSIVTTSKSELLTFKKHKDAIITKNISQGIFLADDKIKFINTVKIVDFKTISNLPKDFHPMLFQEYINKLFELRIFFIFGEFFTCAIFSQNDPKTKIDFRNYNFESKNRTPPFKLPSVISKKLNNLMNKLDINCGSIDMIVSDEKEFIFLEVNPIGQFAQLSRPCNYYLEKKIAKTLIYEV